MADTVKFGMLRKLLRALGLSEPAVNDLFDWITDRLADEQQESAANEAKPIFPYRVRDDFLSPAEHSFYQVLKTVVGPRVHICPKVSLSDLFFVKSSDAGEWRTYTNKIDRKHVDFVLCDPRTMAPVAGVELDDKSHQRADRKVRDAFVEGVFAAAGLALLRVPAKQGYQAQELSELVEQVLPAAVGDGVPAEIATAITQPAVDATRTNGEPAALVHRHEEKSVVSDSPTCPKCGSEMKLRTAKKGENQGQQFWGCSNFPRCRTMLPCEPAVVQG